MSSQAAKAKLFHSLHVTGNPVILFNIWDPGSARAVAGVGASAIATGSASVALANGFPDGEGLPLEIALANIERIVDSVDLPVSIDFEGGYGTTPDAVAANVTRVMATGVAGFNFEDQVVGGEGLYSIEDQGARIAAIRQAVDKTGVAGFINARTDIFLKAKPEQHTAEMVDQAIVRASAYEKSGADGFFAPGLADESFIQRICQEVSLPVNIIALPHVPPLARLIELGAARISYGPVPYRQMLKFVEEGAAEVYG